MEQTLQDAIVDYLQRTVDPDIFRRMHVFKIGALARKQAYIFMKTPAARAADAKYPEVADMMETYLNRRHAEIRANKRRSDRIF